VLLWAREEAADDVAGRAAAATDGWADVRRVAFAPDGAVATRLG
jgi:hypothetical protein